MSTHVEYVPEGKELCVVNCKECKGVHYEFLLKGTQLPYEIEKCPAEGTYKPAKAPGDK